MNAPEPIVRKRAAWTTLVVIRQNNASDESTIILFQECGCIQVLWYDRQGGWAHEKFNKNAVKIDGLEQLRRLVLMLDNYFL
mmetsp:Transcript_9109/g.19194  ORF Transcript_9109/g.19194 Transcript_9109/m.19194 type:complete len:82 (-) Transcript_9109:2-247(-)